MPGSKLLSQPYENLHFTYYLQYTVYTGVVQ